MPCRLALIFLLVGCDEKHDHGEEGHAQDEKSEEAAWTDNIPPIPEGADPDLADAAGHTAMMDAATNGHLEVVRLLITRNADVDATDGKGDNALGAAERGGHDEVTAALKEAGAKPPKKP